MSITLGQLKTELTYALGTAETALLTNDKRVYAINKGMEELLKMYPVPQYTVPVTLSFVSGVATLPTDCLQPYLMREPTSNVTYDLVDFDRFRSNLMQTYNIYWDTAGDAEKVRIYSPETLSLEFTYIQLPTALVDDTDTIRLGTWWSKAIAELAAEQLYLTMQNFSSATAKHAVAIQVAATAWQTERARLQGTQDQRLQSVYEKRGLISSGSRLRN